MPNSSDIDSRAGATRDDEMGEISVNKETLVTAAHLVVKFQFFGFLGSSGPVQVTRFGSLGSGAVVSTFSIIVEAGPSSGSR